MELLIMRHGEAVGEAPGLGDEGRFLTEKGRKLTRKVARWLSKRPRRTPTAVWTSPLVRAVQTAEILAEVAGMRAGVTVRAELLPGRDPGDLLNLLRTQTLEGPLALVGHEPSLSLLAQSLLALPSFPGFKKSGLLAVGWDGTGTAELRFIFDPKTLVAHTSLAELGK